MTAPDPRQVRQEMEIAHEMLSDAQDALLRGRLRSALSRAYYANFHAARALLWTKGIAPKTHKGLIQQFSQHVIKTNILDKSYGAILKDAFDERELADYHAISGSFERLEVEKAVKNATLFLEAINRLFMSTNHAKTVANLDV